MGCTREKNESVGSLQKTVNVSCTKNQRGETSWGPPKATSYFEYSERRFTGSKEKNILEREFNKGKGNAGALPLYSRGTGGKELGPKSKKRKRKTPSSLNPKRDLRRNKPGQQME